MENDVSAIIIIRYFDDKSVQLPTIFITFASFFVYKRRVIEEN